MLYNVALLVFAIIWVLTMHGANSPISITIFHCLMVHFKSTLILLIINVHIVPYTRECKSRRPVFHDLPSLVGHVEQLLGPTTKTLVYHVRTITTVVKWSVTYLLNLSFRMLLFWKNRFLSNIDPCAAECDVTGGAGSAVLKLKCFNSTDPVQSRLTLVQEVCHWHAKCCQNKTTHIHPSSAGTQGRIRASSLWCQRCSLCCTQGQGGVKKYVSTLETDGFLGPLMHHHAPTTCWFICPFFICTQTINEWWNDGLKSSTMIIILYFLVFAALYYWDFKLCFQGNTGDLYLFVDSRRVSFFCVCSKCRTASMNIQNNGLQWRFCLK